MKSAEQRGDCTGSEKNALDQMRRALPKYQSKTIVDIPLDFRKYSSNICGREISGRASALNYLFWNNQRLAIYYNGSLETPEICDDELCLQHANEALSLLPKLQEGETPHKCEMFARTLRASAHYCMKDYEVALVEYRVVLAAIRLLDHAGRLDISNPNDPLVKIVNIWPHTIIRMTIKLKIQKGLPRPYFTIDEYLDLMKELAYGVYSPSSQKCLTCGKTENLSLCSRCKEAWFCDTSCAKEAWKAGHKQNCRCKKYTGDIMGKEQTVIPFMMPSNNLRTVLGEIDDIDEIDDQKAVKSSTALGIAMINTVDRNFLVLCRDPSSGEIFDALTDQTFQLQEGRTITRGSGSAIHFHCLPVDPRGGEMNDPPKNDNCDEAKAST